MGSQVPDPRQELDEHLTSKCTTELPLDAIENEYV